MSEKYQIQIGGDLEKALQGNFELDLKSVLREGWENTRHTKWVMLQGILLAVAISYALIAFFVPVHSMTDLAQLQSRINPLAAMTITILITPIMTAVQMMGISHSLGGQSRFGDLFRFIPHMLILGVTELATGLLINIGLSLFILPGIYLLITSCFAIPLVAERKLPPLKAIWYSIKVVNHKLWQFGLLFVLFLALMMLCAFTLGLAYIWVGPFYYNVKGVLYRNIFGTRIKFAPEKQQGQGKDESVFDA
ncbi:hypothetical protein [Neptunicella sp. SCSIO 80796]|uniref:hypothetical protein n=1 Tax=Neptunicella plasticusilytica TaxID=3117012 RepID=UPI003A4D2046